jgi:DNA polymerase V
MERVIALVDCNSFYCSCERLFRPDLRDKPVGVLSNNDGCFVSRTKEVKEIGIPMGAPYFKYKELCAQNKVHVFSANFSLYTNLSDRVMKTLSHLSPAMEVYSVDEAFLDLTGIPQEGLQQYCRTIKETVWRHTGIPVSIGVATSKTLAKVANHMAKKNEQYHGVYICLDQKSTEQALHNTPIEKVWGIGRRSSIKFRSLGIKTALDLKNYKNGALIQKMFTKVGYQTQQELRGRSFSNLSNEIVKKKEIMSSRTFGAPVFSKVHLQESVACYASLAAQKLRAQKSSCATIEVWVRTNPHKDVEQYYANGSYHSSAHTSDTRKIIKHAWSIVDKLFKQGVEYKKASVKISGLRDKHEAQLCLFSDNDDYRSDQLMLVMDKINNKEGPGTIRSMACGVDNKAWKMKQTLRSPRYVTGWTELPRVLT